MEKAFGQDFSQVNIHTNSQKASEVNALAFTQGNDIHFAPGQYNPYSTEGQNLIGHELTHVLQQRNGKVNPNRHMPNGAAINDQPDLEREADALGRRAANGGSVHRSGDNSGSLSTQNDIIQRQVDTFGGTWTPDIYRLIDNFTREGRPMPPGEGYKGAAMKLRFTPNDNADAESIGFVQTVQSVKGGRPTWPHYQMERRSINENEQIVTAAKRTDLGTAIDRDMGHNTPIYGSGFLDLGENIEDSQINPRETIGKSLNIFPGIDPDEKDQYGHRYRQNGEWTSQDAILFDASVMGDTPPGSHQIFETSAFAIRGNHQGLYYGSVKWGWELDRGGKLSLINFDSVGHDVPSSTLMKAAELWNTPPVPGITDWSQLPVYWTGTIANTESVYLRTEGNYGSDVRAELPRGTSVTVMESSGTWLQVQVVTGQNGIRLQPSGESALMTGNLLRGYVPFNTIDRHPNHVR